ncbi:hypothetical protein MKZ38_005876 [Zalerion maritima]|uniref:Uncharacterized protein n=1 Tax=Zalerion maritima TaxID=339359 RepID=A0AAD5WQN7_9PEZI|nr:hypothetical protein MKZ38_005876 [Zalerion maritima]
MAPHTPPVHHNRTPPTLTKRDGSTHPAIIVLLIIGSIICLFFITYLVVNFSRRYTGAPRGGGASSATSFSDGGESTTKKPTPRARGSRLDMADKRVDEQLAIGKAKLVAEKIDHGGDLDGGGAAKFGIPPDWQNLPVDQQLAMFKAAATRATTPVGDAKNPPERKVRTNLGDTAQDYPESVPGNGNPWVIWEGDDAQGSTCAGSQFENGDLKVFVLSASSEDEEEKTVEGSPEPPKETQLGKGKGKEVIHETIPEPVANHPEYIQKGQLDKGKGEETGEEAVLEPVVDTAGPPNQSQSGKEKRDWQEAYLQK